MAKRKDPALFINRPRDVSLFQECLRQAEPGMQRCKTFIERVDICL